MDNHQSPIVLASFRTPCLPLHRQAHSALAHSQGPLLFHSSHQLPVADEHRRDIPVVGIDPQDEHSGITQEGFEQEWVRITGGIITQKCLKRNWGELLAQTEAGEDHRDILLGLSELKRAINRHHCGLGVRGYYSTPQFPTYPPARSMKITPAMTPARKISTSFMAPSTDIG